MDNRQRLVVCAAILNRESGALLCGPRHGHCLNSAVALGVYKEGEKWECGFVDRDNVYMTRAEAWKVADAAGQIRRPSGWERHYDSVRPPNVGDEGLLFSENLY